MERSEHVEHRPVNGQVKTAEALSSEKLVLEPVFSKWQKKKKKKVLWEKKGRILFLKVTFLWFSLAY